MSFHLSLQSRLMGALAALVCLWLAAPAAANASSYSDSVLADGPLVYYQLNETAGTTAADSSGNGIDGTYAGATLGLDGPFPGAGKAVSFNGSGSVSASLAGPAHTAELWIKPSVRNAQMSFITHGDPSADGWTVGLGAKRKLVFKTGGRSVSSKFPVAVGRWTMIDVTWTSSSVSFALNGGQSQFKTKVLPVAAPGPASPAELTVGGGAAGDLGGFKGSVDEVALYPTALTRAQIGAHFAATGLPVNTVLPAISGVPRVGQTLSTDNGTWTGSPSFTYQWQGCDTGGNCNDIAGATGSSVTLTPGELNEAIQVVVTATNAIGASSATSQPTAPVVTTGPVNLTPPSISGSGMEGKTLTADPGTWDDQGAPVTFSYQWQRCDVDGENCADIDGATAGTYLLGSADVGNSIAVTVTATDASAKQSSATSDPTAIVVAQPAGTVTGIGSGAGAGSAGAGGAPVGAPVACPAHLASLPKRISRAYRGLGKVRLRFTRGLGTTALKAVLVLHKRVRSVDFRLDGKRLKRLRHSPFRAKVPASRLRSGATQTLRVIVVPRHGRKVTLKIQLRVAACS